MKKNIPLILYIMAIVFLTADCVVVNYISLFLGKILFGASYVLLGLSFAAAVYDALKKE